MNKVRKDDFWDLSISWLKEDFWTESLALSYLNEKFWEEVSEEIKERIAKTLSADLKYYDT